MHILLQNSYVLISISTSLNPGASALLYLKGIAAEFNDIDLMVVNEDVELVKEIMKALEGELLPPKQNKKYRSRAFLQYVVSGVEVDVMAEFAVVFEGQIYDCSLHQDQIVEYYELEGEKIPLQSIDLWCRYYELMERDTKVQLIKNAVII